MTLENSPQKRVGTADLEQISQATQITELSWQELQEILGNEFAYPKHLAGDFLKASTFFKSQFGEPKISKYQWSWKVEDYQVDLVWKKTGEAHNTFIRVAKTKPKQEQESSGQPRLF